jgi:hypothetical protein
MALSPLMFPTPWPPPRKTRPIGQISVVGSIVDGLCFLFTGDPELQAIETQIIRQLEARPDCNDDWPTDAKQRGIVRVLSNAVCDEKLCRQGVALHPDDPVALLMWGYYDDLTPLLSKSGLMRLFGLKKLPAALPEFFQRDVGSDLLASRRTVRDLVEFYAARLPEMVSGPEHQGRAFEPWWNRIPTPVGIAIIAGAIAALALLMGTQGIR